MTHPAAPDRLHGLDAVRGFALLMGLALHAAMSYLPGSQYFWVTSDSGPSQSLSVLFFWVHSFRMTLFFLLAGYFARHQLHRLGLGQFVRDRLRRIVVPLLGAWPLVFAAIVVVVVWGAWLENGGSFPQEPPPPQKFTPDSFPLTHLWFLYVLTLLYAALLVLRGVFHRLDRGGRFQAWLDIPARAIAGPWAPLVVALPVAAALFALPMWWHWFGVPTPDQSLYPSLAACLAFGLAFLGGWALHRLPDLLAALPHRAPWNLAIGLAGTVSCLSLAGLVPPQAAAAKDAVTAAYAFAYAASGWGWSLGLIGLSLRYLSGPSPARRYLADASYWIYLVHLPVVMAGQVLATRSNAPWWIEYPLVLGGSFVFSLGSYHLFVRHSPIGAALNGRRFARAGRSAVAPAVAPMR